MKISRQAGKLEKGKYCEFHKHPRHDIVECSVLKKEMDNSQKSQRNELATRPKIDENKNIEKGLEILAT